ncbi:nuclear transport factor 2 family protein [Allocoleopsis sp.]|uniref:nuclear transport factor 2 family protein n=1 Tax=Allocoleopsis sp. TaxID=3088169 RepID=UPI002FCED7D3
MTIAKDNSTNTQPATAVDLTIEGIEEPVVERYFQTMNAGEYEGTAALFAPTGVMHPPFEEPIEGPEAIAIYLKAEAKGMQLFPREGITETLEENQIQIQVRGKVQTPLFGVNVAWIFILNLEREIVYAKIKLLASPQELLNLRR